MLSVIQRHKKTSAAVILIGACVALLWLWPLTAAVRGRLVAEIDVRNGHYELQTYGLPVSWRPEFARLLSERYGISEHVIGGCTVSPSQRAYANAYDQVVAAAVNRKFGKDVFMECATDAKRNWEAVHSSMPAE